MSMAKIEHPRAEGMALQAAAKSAGVSPLAHEQYWPQALKSVARDAGQRAQAWASQVLSDRAQALMAEADRRERWTVAEFAAALPYLLECGDWRLYYGDLNRLGEGLRALKARWAADWSGAECWYWDGRSYSFEAHPCVQRLDKALAEVARLRSALAKYERVTTSTSGQALHPLLWAAVESEATKPGACDEWPAEMRASERAQGADFKGWREFRRLREQVESMTERARSSVEMGRRKHPMFDWLGMYGLDQWDLDRWLSVYDEHREKAMADMRSAYGDALDDCDNGGGQEGAA